jgi:hypothetical protein
MPFSQFSISLKLGIESIGLQKMASFLLTGMFGAPPRRAAKLGIELAPRRGERQILFIRPKIPNWDIH